MTIPPEAITAAAGAIYDQSATPTSGRGDLAQWSNRLAVAALEAAAPLLAAAERQRIAAHVTIMRDETADQARQAHALPSTSRILKAEAETLNAVLELLGAEL